MLIGAHMSIAGGMHKALERGRALGCETVQIFLRSNMAWHAGTLTPERVQRFREAQRETDISPVVAHSCYLINLASTDARTRSKSLLALTDELKRAEVLGVPYLAIHPGAHMGAGEAAGLRKVARGIDRAFRASETRNVRILLETTAGAGTVLGSRFEHIAELLTLSDFVDRLGVCYDTCHGFAAGYDIRTRRTYLATMRKFNKIIGLEHLLCFHLNGTMGKLGSRRDRHAHIGKGELGEDAFAYILRDKRFKSIPKILETPKGTYRRRPWDKINLDTLRRLAGDG